MRIIVACVVAACLTAAVWAADDHRSPKKKDDRGKRNLEYQISHHYPGGAGHSYRLERRISNGPQHPSYPPSQFYPGPPNRPPSPYRKDSNDLVAENDQIQEKVQHEYHYLPHKPHVIERPVYIKEPEPIIEIIIKESNVSLPPPPTAPPQKKKKEQVQVFYVKYKKNPHGTGKDSVIYDKPIPAISPQLPGDNEEEEEPSYDYYKETATAPPPPSTTLRTIIKPDSEVYHSPSGVKVTFGKEGFDYEKRSSKPEDYVPPQQAQFPQGRQLSSFSNTYFKRPLPNQSFQGPSPNVRQPQPYRPFTFPQSQPPPNYKPLSRQTPQFPSQPKYPSFQSQSFSKQNQQYANFQSSRPQVPPSPQFSHTITHPPPSHFQNPRPSSPSQSRQPVAYKPFENLRPQQPQQTFVQSPPTHLNPSPQQPQIPFRPETHFPTHQQLPLTQQSHSFNAPSAQQTFKPPSGQQTFNTPSAQQTFNPPATQQTPQINNQQFRKEEAHQSRIQQPQVQYQHQVNHQFGSQIQQQQQQYAAQNEHLSNLQTAQAVLPPGGQLIQSLPKYEQHISEVHHVNEQKSQGISPNEFQQKVLEQFNLNTAQNNQPNPQQGLLNQQQQIQQILDQQRQQQRQQQEEQLRSAQQYYQQAQQRNHQNDISHTTPRVSFQATRRTSQYINSTPRISYQTTTPKPTTTTTQEPETPSTTTKDPKILEAQLPDEVPDDLREQLLASGILNHADISVLDYDKVGDIPLSALPPEQLANFYNAGGGAQISAGSAPEPAILQQDGAKVDLQLAQTEEDQEPEASEIQEVKVVAPPSGVEMKVVHYDPDTDKGKDVQESYVEEDARQVDPVVLNDNTYNRYLPLKVNGTQFPIPDVPELKGKKISSVVVLAPVTYDFSSSRKTRAAAKPSNDIDLIQDDALKRLLGNPTLENYRKFLDNENRTRSDKQAVILLVADPQEIPSKEKEIFMYDVATQTVSKLSGELSSAFVEAAEANSDDAADESVEAAAAASNIIETRLSFSGDIDRYDVDANGSEFVDSKVSFVDPNHETEVMEAAEASEQLENLTVASESRVLSKEESSVSRSEINSNFVENQSIKIG